MLTRIHCLMNSLFKNKTQPKIQSKDTCRQTTVALGQSELLAQWANPLLFSANLAIKTRLLLNRTCKKPVNICTVLKRCQIKKIKVFFCIKTRNCWNHWEESQWNSMVFLQKHWYVQQGDQLSLRLDPGCASRSAHWEGDQAKDPSWPLQHSENT